MRVVAIGGGHGLAATLRGCLPWAACVTAVVSTADDGGSTGRLRESWEVPAPGDVRRCLAAIGVDGAVWTTLLERRFDAGELAGHAVGNLLLLALTEELGSLQAACDEIARICDVPADRARVVPITDESVVLCGSGDGVRAEGQVAVAETRGIDEVWVEPPSTAASPIAMEEVLASDLVVLGPGSLYTSVLAAAVVGDLRKAVAERRGRLVYVCNVRADGAEAHGYDVADHVAALARHDLRPDIVVCQPGALGGTERLRDDGVEVAEADVVRPNGLAHDPAKLGAVLRGLG